MDKKNSNTAFLIFIRTANEEAIAKSFCSGLHKSGNRFIANRLNQQIIRTVKETNFPFFIISSKQQLGDSFGARITHAIDHVFAEGYEKLVVVGNDCPSLNTKNLLEIVDHLEENDLVLGPNLRGGVYAMGLHRKSYDNTIFKNLSWETSYLLDDFRIYAQHCQIQLLTLVLASDINNAFDFYNLAKDLASLTLLMKQLLSFLASHAKNFSTEKTIFRIFRIEHEIILRGPPIFLTFFHKQT